MTKYSISVLFLCLNIIFSTSLAQEDAEGIVLVAGDPPLASRITVIDPLDDPLTVEIVGEVGAVFPSAQVAIRNLYTNVTEYSQARFDGSFEASIIGTANMPYQINADTRYDQNIKPEILSGLGVVIHPEYEIRQQGIDFGIGGLLAYGAGSWLAEGRINQVDFLQDDTMSIWLDIHFLLEDFDPTLDYVMLGELSLRRYVDENGQPLSTALETGHTWSSDLTSTGVPILGRTVPDQVLTNTITDDIDFDEETGILTFSLSFETQLSPNLLSGVYAPVFRGELSVNGSESVDWYANRFLSVDGEGGENTSATVMPLLLNVGNVQDVSLRLSLFDTEPATDIPILPLGAYTFRPKLDSLPLIMPFTSATSLGEEVPLVVEDGMLTLWRDYLFGEEYRATEVNVLGEVRDGFGRNYTVNQQFPVHIAEQLTLLPSVLVGTPLFPETHIAITGSVSPPTAATITYGVTDGTAQQVQANRFGYFVAENIMPTTSEYRIDLDAQADILGIPYRASRSLSGVVVTDEMVTFGNYGLADYDANPQAWFDTATYPSDAPDVLPFVNFPYFSGDVAYVPDSENSGINPVLSAGDYQYLSIVRPDMTLAHFVQDTEAIFDARLSNDDVLDNSIGIGSEGNRPEDVMWLFGGSVSGDNIQGYSSIAVVTDDASARVVPPFTEALLFDDGNPVDLFLLPTGVRAGQVLEIGDIFVMSGYTAPTVAADIETRIVTPSETIVNTTQARSFGYFYEPEHNFIVDDAGVYEMSVDAHYDGTTSAGLLPEAVNGTVLGSDNGSYLFFVVDAESPMLVTPREAISEVVSGQAFTINVRAPQDWTDVTAYYVVRSPQWILEQGTLDTFANQTNYTFNWAQIARLFPNIEARATEASDIDEITFSFAFTGLDAEGNSQIQARMFTLRGNTLYTSDE